MPFLSEEAEKAAEEAIRKANLSRADKNRIRPNGVMAQNGKTPLSKDEEAIMKTNLLLMDPNRFWRNDVKAWIRTLSSNKEILSCAGEVDKGYQLGENEVKTKTETYATKGLFTWDHIARLRVDGNAGLANIADAVYRLDPARPDWSLVRTECAKTGFQLGQIDAIKAYIANEQARQKKEADAAAARAKAEAGKKDAKLKVPTTGTTTPTTTPPPAPTSTYLFAGVAIVAVVGIGAYFYLRQ